MSVINKIMKSSLVATAVMASLAVPAMAADVTVYGRAHLSLDSLDNGDESGTNVSSNSSRLGFRASTKIEDNLEAFVQIEQNVRFDEGSGNFASRDTFVGIRGSFGQVRAGQFDTPLKAVRGKVDMFGDRVGDIRNLTRTSTSGGADIGNVFDERYKNGIHYRTPKLGNVTLDLHYTPHNNTGATTDNIRESYSIAASYEVKGFYAGIAYESFEGSPASGLDPNALRIGVYYDVNSDFRVSGLYQNASDVPGGERVIYGLGASYKIGDYTLRGQYYIADDNDSSDTGATMLAIGGDRKLGKDLTLYLVYGITSNDDNAAFRVSAGGRDTAVSAITGENVSGLSLGIIYNF